MKEVHSSNFILIKTLLSSSIIALCCTVTGLTCPQPPSPRPPFDFWEFHSVGEDPVGMVIADFTGDSVLDIATANQADRSVSLLAGLGDGSFVPSVSVSLDGVTPTSIVTADVTGDGIDDVVLTDREPDFISILPGSSDGFSGEEIRISSGLGREVSAVAVADFDGDGIIDLVAGTHLSSDTRYSFLRGTGEGQFEEGRLFNVNADAFSMQAADLNRDGRQDLIVGGGSFDAVNAARLNGLVVLLGKGNGQFESQQLFESQGNTNFVIVTDLNNDGVADVVSASMLDDVNVFMGHGDGTFNDPLRYQVGSSERGVPVVIARLTSVCVADFTGDGIPDLAATDSGHPNFAGTDALYVLQGMGGEHFGRPFKVQVGLREFACAAADLNGDGAQDIAVLNRGDNMVAVNLLTRWALFPAGALVTIR